jgi:hypothetical protein
MCRRKIEMSPGVQSRDDTPLAADMTSATGHHSAARDAGQKAEAKRWTASLQ